MWPVRLQLALATFRDERTLMLGLLRGKRQELSERESVPIRARLTLEAQASPQTSPEAFVCQYWSISLSAKARVELFMRT